LERLVESGSSFVCSVEAESGILIAGFLGLDLFAIQPMFNQLAFLKQSESYAIDFLTG